MALTAQGRIELYAGTPRTGWEAVERSWPALKRTGLFRIQSVRITARQIRASCGVAASHTAPSGSAPLLAAAERDAAAIAAERAPYSAPTAALLTAGVAARRGAATAPDRRTAGSSTASGTRSQALSANRTRGPTNPPRDRAHRPTRGNAAGVRRHRSPRRNRSAARHRASVGRCAHPSGVGAEHDQIAVLGGFCIHLRSVAESILAVGAEPHLHWGIRGNAAGGRGCSRHGQGMK